MLKKILLLFLVGCSLCLPAVAQAAKIEDMWVTGTTALSASGEGTGEDTVHWFRNSTSKNYYFFLPTTTQEKITLYFTGPETLKMDGKTIRSGAVIDTPASGTMVTFESGKTKIEIEFLKSANLPTLFIHTESGSLDFIHESKQNREPGTLLMIMPDGEIAYHGALTEIRGRGNASFTMTKKKPYQIKLEKKTDLCGLGADKTWLLLANMMENTMLRNRITFDMARAAGIAFTPNSAFCDLYMNGIYVGTYELCTKVEPGSDRVDIPDLEKMTEEVNDAALDSYKTFGPKKSTKGRYKGYKIPNDPEDITGGYLLELDYPARFEDEASGYTTKKGQPIVVKYPEYASEKQMDFISELIQNAEDAFRAVDGINPKTGKHYTEYLDLDSFVLKYMLEEIVKNYDAVSSSQFVYKLPDSVSPLLYAGPVWDYDGAYGNYGTKEFVKPRGFFANNVTGARAWYPGLYQQADFRWRVQEMYAQVYRPILEALLGKRDDVEGITSIQEYVAFLDASATMNYKRWVVFNIASRRVKTGKDYAANIEYLTNFIEERMAFLDEKWLVPYEQGKVAPEVMKRK